MYSSVCWTVMMGSVFWSDDARTATLFVGDDKVLEAPELMRSLPL